jgi:hypothetical protein
MCYITNVSLPRAARVMAHSNSTGQREDRRGRERETEREQQSRREREIMQN